MAEPYDAPMPPAIDLSAGYTIELVAVNPTSGNVISAITVSDLVIFPELVGDTSAGDLAYGPYLLVPGSGG